MPKVHFDFTVSDVDAENIMQIMRNSLVRQDKYIMEAISKRKIDDIRWHKLHKKYLEELIKKMTNFRTH